MAAIDDQPKAGPKRALVVGADGVVGRHLLRLLLARDDYVEVRALLQRRLALRHPRLRQVLVDYGHLGQAARHFAVEHVYCCLGGGGRPGRRRATFAKTDYAYPYRAAQLAAEHGAQHFVWISAVGANRSSRVFYLRVKAELEAEIARLPLPACTAVRPALMLGPRRERPASNWLAMQAMRPLAPLLLGPLRKFRVIAAGDVAQSMIDCANGGGPVPGLEVVRYRSPAPRWRQPAWR